LRTADALLGALRATRDMNEIFDESVSFADLGLRSSLLKGLEAAGFKQPTHIQAQLIPMMLGGSDILGQAKTGTGKTAAFGLPIHQQADKDTSVQALILAPTRELASQIVVELNELGRFTPIKAISIVGGESFVTQRKGLQGGAHIIVGTPGRVMDLQRRGDLRFDHIRWVVLDEVDRMLDIGFREDIRKILSLVKQDHQTVFVSATISAEIERLARKFMHDDVQKIKTVAASLTVSQVTQKYVPVPRRDKRRMLLHLLKHEDPELTLVFCRMKVTVRDVARYLKDHDIDAFEIHGDLPQGKRNRIMQRFRSGKLEVMVASDLASRGLDVDGITHIVNYDLPEDPEVYVHRIGRTARAGREGTAWSFVEPTEGQRLTEIEKLTGVLIERLEYGDFQESAPREADGEPRESATRKPAVDRSKQSVHGAHEESDSGPDPNLFPGGVVPKGPPKKTLGSRLATRRRR
jgi:ATP-dependent RNA helicase DeaD